VFISAVSFGLHLLRTALENGAEIVGVVTRESGHHSDGVNLLDICCQYNIPALSVSTIKEASVESFIYNLSPDLTLVMGWSEMIPDDILAIPRITTIGSHPTLLPHGRGRAPIPWTILKGLKESGLTFFILDSDVDTGDIVLQRRFDIGPKETATTLYDKIIAFGKEMLMEILSMHEFTGRPQDSSHTYWKRRTDRHGRIDWSRSSDEIERLVRATTHPYPGAWTMAGVQKVRILTAKTEPQSTSSSSIGSIFGHGRKGFLVQCGVGMLHVINYEPEGIWRYFE
jgi:methionyl-tRNA formyltransferase